MENANFNSGGTGANLFAGGAEAGQAASQSIGDEYIAPKGLPEWKQPGFDDDDRVREKDLEFKPQGFWGAIWFMKNEMTVAKTFYFCFFGAFGSLFPLFSVFFKGIAMDAFQTGFLVGIRPIIEYLATPFWHGISDRFQAGKVLLLLSVACWIIFTVPVYYIHPPVVSCKFWNGSQYQIMEPEYMVEEEREKRSVDDMLFSANDRFSNIYIDEGDSTVISSLSRIKRSDDAQAYRWAPGYVVGSSPYVIYFNDTYKNHEKRSTWLTPSFSNEVFEQSGVEKVFFLLLLVVIIGEFFASPAIALADSAIITSLGEKQDQYGSQRMYGSIGWGVLMFIMGIVLDYSNVWPDARCKMNPGERNYNVCFFMFALMMFIAFLVATQIQFRYTSYVKPEIPLGNIQNGGPQGKPTAKTHDQRMKEQAERMKVFASQLRSMPEFGAVVKALTNIRLLMFMLTAWVMGIGIGLIFTFLFWHLQDYGGHPTIFGIASVINHISEMGAYFYSFKIISQYGHVKVLMVGLLGNVIRFIYISFITWPWLVLPFEFLQGITHAAVWAACCSFISHNTDAELRPSMQSFLQGIHHGFGRFCGAVFGGLLIKEHGSTMVFRMYGLVCAGMLVLFTLVNFYNMKEGGFSTDLGEDIDPRNVMESEHLAPHGVPGGFKPMPRSRRNSGEDVQAAVTQPNPMDDPAMATNNPFMGDVMFGAGGGQVAGAEAGDQSQYYGRGYSQAQSGYSSSGLGY